MTIITELKTLYEIDPDQWLEETIKILKENRFHELDLENLIEELEDLGRSEKNAVESLLEQVIRHFIYHLTFIIYHSFGSRGEVTSPLLETSPKLLSP